MTAPDLAAAETLPGSHFPLGATVSPGGPNFAVASAAADGIARCRTADRQSTAGQARGAAKNLDFRRVEARRGRQRRPPQKDAGRSRQRK